MSVQVKENFGLVRQQANRLLGRGLEFEDLVSEGSIQPVISCSAYSNAEEFFTEQMPQISANRAIGLLWDLGEEIAEIVLMRLNGLTYKRIDGIVGQASKAIKACCQDVISYLKRTLNLEVLEELQK